MTRLDTICVSPVLSLQEAVRVLNEGHKRIVLVVDDERKLLGVVADSDIRRAILQGLSFDEPVHQIMVSTPVIASTDMNDSAIFALMQAKKCYEIPVIDREGKVIDLRQVEEFLEPQEQAEVIIMAGGMGTRLRPLTESIPKPLVPVGEKPVLFLILNQLLMEGFRKITLALNYKAEMIKDAVTKIPEYRECVRFIEEEERLGTAGSLSLLTLPPSSAFFVMNADLLTQVDFRMMLRFHEAEGNTITMAVRQERYQMPFGVVKLQGSHVSGIEEKPIRSDFVNAGMYVLEPSVLPLVPEKSYYDMPELINDVIETGKQVGTFPLHEYWLDIGRHDELQQARKDIPVIFQQSNL